MGKNSTKKLLAIILVSCVFRAHDTLAQNTTNGTDQLQYIGMPVGGITAGQVYLGGDGQLWYWDIFNIQRIQPGGPGDKFYLNPLTQERTFEQGFAVKVKNQRFTPQTRILREGGFNNIAFKGEYPIGKVSYQDEAFPVSVKLQAYTPFIPTDHESSDFPAVVLEYTLTNISKKELTAELIGWLQNMANFQTAEKAIGKHHNQIVKSNNAVQLQLASSVEETNKDLPDYGNMALTLLDGQNIWGTPRAPRNIVYNIPELNPSDKTEAEVPLGQTLTGALGKEMTLKPGESQTVTYILSWYFPNLHREESGFHHLKNKENLRNYYSKKFTSSQDVAQKIAANSDKYLNTTKLWNKTWYDSSLPKWFLERSFLNTSTLATTSSYRVDDLTDDPDNEGRFYTAEGVYLGHGTCTHVFHYEQALGRVFPSLARQLRTQIDYGYSFEKNGIIKYRSQEFAGYGSQDGRDYAIDGHAGTVMRAYREHTTSANNNYLKQYWPKIKKSIEYMIAHDAEKSGTPEGILEGIQYNTLDRIWYGKISWISTLYNAALLAGEAMANDMGDKAFAKKCAGIAEQGKKNISEQLFNGEYFYQILDPEHLDAPNSNKGCHADQLLGQYWTKQVGLADVVPSEKAKTALESIFKYNYFSRYDAHLDNAEIPVSRYYALPDEPVMIMCSFPKGGADQAPGKINNDWEKLVVGYFSEPWTGQEHQVAASMIDHGLLEQAMTIEEAVHTRYSPQRRNPYNEIEYGNHYTRAMSGYAPFISASGFTLHEPKGEIGFAPKIKPDDFKSAFISGSAWGSFVQKRSRRQQTNSLKIEYGAIKLSKITLDCGTLETPKANMALNGKKIRTKVRKNGTQFVLTFKAMALYKGDKLNIQLTNPDKKH